MLQFLLVFQNNSFFRKLLLIQRLTENDGIITGRKHFGLKISS